MARRETGTAVAKPQSSGLAIVDTLPETDELRKKLDEQAGAGTSQARDDVLMPFVYVLQSNSPQVKKNNDRYIQGAEAGMLLRTDTKELFTEMIFQPCAFYKKVNEWIPRDDGGGFVGTHDAMPPGAKAHPTKSRWMTTADGAHDLIDTRYEFGHILYDDGRFAPAVITMKGTQHSVSRSWMVMRNNRLIAGRIAPSFWTAYKLRTVGRENAQGDWFVIEPTVLGWLPENLRAEGEKLHKAVMAGEKKVDHAAEEAEGGDTEDGAI